MTKIGIIGGTGFEASMFEGAKMLDVDTPYGKPSGQIISGKYKGVDVFFIPRHGPKHTINPTQVNNRANIHAMKELGVTHLLAPTACGSLREEMAPGNFVLADQFIDKTTKRDQTFYDKGVVAHISMADPFCEKLRKLLSETAEELKVPHHKKGCLLSIEGPRFSSRAESHMFRSWGCDVLNMSTVPEATLAREKGMCYQPIAMVVDYDCWRKEEKPVTQEEVSATAAANAENVKKLVLAVIPKIKDDNCGCRTAIDVSIIK
ncbi:MAG: S-methyl-5'-thioadenosine phosphorylase [archaeon]